MSIPNVEITFGNNPNIFFATPRSHIENMSIPHKVVGLKRHSWVPSPTLLTK
jgi:hypothetical protein